MKRVLKFILINKRGHKTPKIFEHKGSGIYTDLLQVLEQ